MTLPAKIITGALGLTASISAPVGYEMLRPKNISYLLSKEGSILLDTEKTYTTNESQSEDYKSWKEIIEKQREPNDEISNFGDWKSSSLQEYEKINKLKEKCRNILQTLEKKEGFEENFKNAKKFCIKQS